ncbi:MAG: ferrous iron transport protein A [Ruminococcus sp.]|nr:ferrous iron transport protein A [Ruminococcus sp.]
MIPLTFAETGAENMVKKVGGNPETRRFLEELGFVAGSTVTVVNTMSGNVIVSIKDSRIAISEEMAAKIMI